MAEEDPVVLACQSRLGTELGSKWRLDALIGLGGMAAVYLATRRDGKMAALKLLLPEIAAIPEARVRFLREAEIAKSIDHPGTVEVLGLDADADGTPFLVMELLTGRTVEARAEKAGGRLPVVDVLSIAAQTLDVLSAAHAKGVVHRDIKPANLFLPQKGPLKVLDFGIARLRESNEVKATLQRTRTGMAMGTPAFMAPEQALGRWQSVDARTDLWAVGATMYTLLTGRFAHEGTNPNELLVSAATRPVPSLARSLPGATVDLVAIVDRALAFDPKNRFQSAAEMRAAIQRLSTIQTAATQTLPAQTGAPAPSGPPQAASGRGLAPTQSAPPPAASARGLAPTQSAPPQAASGRVVTPLQSAPPPAASGRGLAPTQSAPPQAASGRVVTPVQSAPPQAASARGGAPPGPVQAPEIRGVSAPPGPSASGAPPARSSDPGALAATAPMTRSARAPIPPLDPSKLVLDPSKLAPKPKAATEASILGIDAGSAPAEHKAALKELFVSIDRALHAGAQYGRDHVEAKRRLAKAFGHATEALADVEDALVWNVTPYSFQAGETALWEPEAPFDRVPYRLFSAGVRTMGILPGLSREDMEELLRLWTLVPVKEVAPEDAVVTLLWDAGFEHVAFEAIDAFAEGDQRQRADFERELSEIVAECRADYHAELERVLASQWTAVRSGEGTPPERLWELLVAADQPVDTEAAARALGVAPERSGPSALADSLRLDPATRAVLAAHLDVRPEDASERFVIAAAEAFKGADRRGNARPLILALHAAMDGLSEVNPGAVVQFVCGLCAAVRGTTEAETQRLRAALASGVFDPATMRRVCTGALAEGPEREAFRTGLGTLLQYVGGAYVAPVLEVIDDPKAEALLSTFLAFLGRAGSGHEPAIGALLPSASVPVGVGLVRVLAELSTEAAKEAVTLGTKSRHALVRIEALGQLEGQSSERLRLELRALLEDPDGAVRLATLRTMAQLRVRAAGPYLVLRIKRSDFEDLSLDERREALSTVGVLTAARAEALCIELLESRRLLASESHEETRELAALMLGEIGHGAEAKKALADAAERRFKSSERVRKAAQRALQMTPRLASIPPPRLASIPPPKEPS